jgi:formylglycine-generating enzyme required for sulfatase activity
MQPLPRWLKPVGTGLVAVVLLGVLIGVVGPPLRDALFAVPTPTPTDTFESPSASSSPPVCTTAGATWIRLTDGMILVCVPGGTFQMGNERSSDASEWTVHEVTLSTFWIDQTEVTNEQYAKCVTAGACTAKNYGAGFDGNDLPFSVKKCDDVPADGFCDAPFNRKLQPVSVVNWYDAAAYCTWAGGQLPTEAQWEYAARGPEGHVYPWGNDWANKVANLYGCEDDPYALPAPVGSFPEGKSWVGALDMAGNVWEWVADWHANYSPEPQTNPQGPTEGELGEYKVLRGGSWLVPRNGLRSTTRPEFNPTQSNTDIGFRCVMASIQE